MWKKLGLQLVWGTPGEANLHGFFALSVLLCLGNLHGAAGWTWQDPQTSFRAGSFLRVLVL